MPHREAMRIKRENVQGLAHRTHSVKSHYLTSLSQAKLGRKNERHPYVTFKREILKRKNLKIVESFKTPKRNKNHILKITF